MQKKLTFYKEGLFILAIGILLSCNQGRDNKNNSDNAPDTTRPVESTVIVKEDSITSQIRPVLVINETNEIQQGGYFINKLDVDSIRYEKISRKDYYLAMKADLTALLHLSTNKEKTQQAIDRMAKEAAGAGTTPDVYKVYFHLNAQTGKIIYNEGHTKYLDKNFKELKR